VLVGDPAYYSRFGFKNDGKMSYSQYESEFVQWLSFDGSTPRGTITFSSAFESPGPIYQ